MAGRMPLDRLIARDDSATATDAISGAAMLVLLPQ
jgi:hypothetical protein